MAQKFRRISMRLVHGTCDARYQSIKQHSTTSCHFANILPVLEHAIIWFDLQWTGSQPLPIFPIFFAAKKTPSARSKSAQRGVPIVQRCSGLFLPWLKLAKDKTSKAKDLIFGRRSLFVDPSTFGQFLIESLEKNPLFNGTNWEEKMEMMMEDSN